MVTAVHDAPYIIAVLPKCVEIRTIEPRLLIQNIELIKPRLVCYGRYVMKLTYISPPSLQGHGSINNRSIGTMYVTTQCFIIIILDGNQF